METRRVTAALAAAVFPDRSEEESGKWVAWVKAAVTLALIGVLYAKVDPQMALVWWNDPAYSHGLLIPPLVCYMVWVYREDFFSGRTSTDGRGMLLVLAACTAYLVGSLGAEFFLTRMSLVMLLAGMVWTFWGLLSSGVRQGCHQS